MEDMQVDDKNDEWKRKKKKNKMHAKPGGIHIIYPFGPQ